MSITEIYAPLDPGISDVVMLLRSHGIDTFSSCEGGEGHDFDMPTVRINPNQELYADEEEIKISKLLSENDYGGYYIKLCHAYQSAAEPWSQNFQHFIEIEFWTYPLCKNADKPMGDEGETLSPIGDLP